ncbi:hypothetical protein GCM10010975_13020 [Comamonas phosphati]|nr:hypothetical protein GCM10010975_13020 [Comamonas phosphati]
MKQQSPKHSRLSLARRLRLQQLAVFEKVVEMGSILAASRELAMTQPAVSKSIHDLEQQLDGLLFVRGKRGVVLTEFGSLFERHTKSMLAELRYLAEDLNDWQSGASGHVIVGTLITASATLLAAALLFCSVARTTPGSTETSCARTVRGHRRSMRGAFTSTARCSTRAPCASWPT